MTLIHPDPFRMHLRSALIPLVAFLTSACLGNPRDRQQIGDPTQIWVQGDVPWPDKPVSIDVSPDGSKWKFIGSTNSITTATVDPIGQKWYEYDTPVYQGLPSSWSSDISTHTAKLRLRTYVRADGHNSGVFDPKQDTALASFDDVSQGAPFAGQTQACIYSHYQNGYSDIINSCSSVRSPVVTIQTECGKQNEICCGDSCDSPYGCSWHAVCEKCGGRGQPACQHTADASHYCSGGYSETINQTCDVCGGSNQIVCISGICSPGYSTLIGRKDNICYPCGAKNEQACLLAKGQQSCNSGLMIDVNHNCVAPPSGQPAPPPPPPPAPPKPAICGAQASPCCAPGNSCQTGLFCVQNFCTKNPPGRCDYVGESCCLDTSGSGASSGWFCDQSYDFTLTCGSNNTCTH